MLRRKRKKLTGAQEHILWILVKVCGDCPQRLKLPEIARRAQVHRNTAKSAIHQLKRLGLIEATRPIADGPDSTWTIKTTHRARVLAASLSLSNENEYLPVSQ